MRITPVIFIALTATVTAAPLSFNRDIRPILSNNCYQCHGPDSAARKAKLRLDREANSRAERKGGTRAIVPGNLAESELIYRITTNDADEKMPPADSHRKLTPKQIKLLKQWIKEGGKYEGHWSFITPKAAPLPKVKMKNWPRNGIDHFVLARLEAKGLKPSPEAEKATLLRRVSFDLIGLPPTLAELDAFLADKSPKAFEKVVDRLLFSPRYGEHMARYWLDAARYADTNGYQYDTHRDMWPWRDWVINAYNRNLLFDQFTIEQLAGDLLPNATLQQRVATGFNRNHPITIEGGVIAEEYRTEYVIDRVTTSAQVWLGMSFLCARCHDHKFDPLRQKEFYQFFAFFNRVSAPGKNIFTPKVTVPSDELAQMQKQLTALDSQWSTREKQVATAQVKWEKSIASNKVPKPTWKIIKPVRTFAAYGTEFKQLPDGSSLAHGENKGKEIYEVVLHTPSTGLTAIRLECLTHDSLPHNGAGRAFNSNFVLSEFTATAEPLKGGDQPQAIKFREALADYSQAKFNIASAIDGKPGTGWAVDGPTKKENRVAMFVANKAFGFMAGTELHIRMQFNLGTMHTIGRFRLSLTDATAPAIESTLSIPRLAALPSTKRTTQQKQRLREYFLAQAATPDVRQLHAKRHQLAAKISQQRGRTITSMVMQDLPNPGKAHVLYRGQYDQKREVVSAGTPAFLPPMPKDAPMNRLGLARWLVSKKHPLTARVTVNREWQRLFGNGIVLTTEEFGIQGDWPSHPQLIDWLAVNFMDNNWDLKALLKLIATSATYRQSSSIRNPSLADPTNRLLSRGPRHRLDAEVIRDNALAVSGLLIEKIGGPSVFPYHPKGLWLELNNRPNYSRTYPLDTGEKLYRRSVYTYWKRTVPPPSMATFDAPEREFCLVRRSRTNTPLQAFVLLHDPQFVEAARQLAAQMIAAAKQPSARIAHGFRIITARAPNTKEQKILQRLYNERLTFYKKNPKAAEVLLAIGESKTAKNLNRTEHAAWTTVARAMMNLSETITKN